MSYCTSADIKDCMLIETGDTSFDTPIVSAITEASRVVDVFLKPYTTVPLTVVDTNIAQLTADFACSIFKRRTIPDEQSVRGTIRPDGMGDLDASGWFAVGLRKLEKYIQSYYIFATTLGNSVYNVDTYVKLAKDGLITLKDAKTFINSANTIVMSQIENMTKNLITNETKTLNETDSINKTVVDNETKTVVDNEKKTLQESLQSNQVVNKVTNEAQVVAKTERVYSTKKQKSFAFISSDGNGGYKKDSEVD